VSKFAFKCNLYRYALAACEKMQVGVSDDMVNKIYGGGRVGVGGGEFRNQKPLCRANARPALVSFPLTHPPNVDQSTAHPWPGANRHTKHPLALRQWLLSSED
jgi:hypothetical protein